MLKVEPIPAFQDNYIWAIHDGHSAAVVDPGEAEPVERFLAQRGLALGAIVITHHHGDHQGGVADLLERHRSGPDGAPIPVVGPAGERIGHRTQAVREGDTVKAGQLLLVLDPTEPAADVERLGSDLQAARIQALKARRVLDAIDRGR